METPSAHPPCRSAVTRAGAQPPFSRHSCRCCPALRSYAALRGPICPRRSPTRRIPSVRTEFAADVAATARNSSTRTVVDGGLGGACRSVRACRAGRRGSRWLRHGPRGSSRGAVGPAGGCRRTATVAALPALSRHSCRRCQALAAPRPGRIPSVRTEFATDVAATARNSSMRTVVGGGTSASVSTRAAARAAAAVAAVARQRGGAAARRRGGAAARREAGQLSIMVRTTTATARSTPTTESPATCQTVRLLRGA